MRIQKIEARPDTPASDRRPGSPRLASDRYRIATAAVALGIAAAGFAVAVVSFRGEPARVSESEPVPVLAPRANGPIYFRVGGGEGGGSIEAVEPDGSGRRVAFAGEPVRVSGIAWSPDGRRIAYHDPVVGARGIYVANADGSQPLRLTDGVNDGWPSWSPDGSRILFSSTRHDPAVEQCTPGFPREIGCPTDAYVMDADGSNVVRLSDDPAPEDMPVWSPDGSRIAFVRELAEGRSAVFTMTSEGSDVRQVSNPNGGTDLWPSWSPSGTHLVFAAMRDGNWGLWVVDADGTDERPILGGDGAWYANNPVWSPDGSLIAFVGNPSTNDYSVDDALYVVRPDGAGIARLAEAPGVGITGDIAWRPLPALSSGLPVGTIRLEEGSGIPEGTLLLQVGWAVEALSAGSDHSVRLADHAFAYDLSADGSKALIGVSSDGPAGTRIEMVDLATGARETVATLDEVPLPVRWSPDGSRVAYRLGMSRDLLCVIDLMASSERCYPELGRVFDFDWAPDGTQLVLGLSIPVPLTVLDVQTGTATPLVRSDDGDVLRSLEEAGFGRATRVQFQGPRLSPSGRYVATLAMVFETVGGTEGNVVLVFDTEGNLVASGVPMGEFPGEARDWAPTVDVFAYGAGEPPYRIVDVRLIDPETGDDRILLSTGEPAWDVAQETVQGLSWAPSGRSLGVLTAVPDHAGWFTWQLSFVEATGGSASVVDFPVEIQDLVDWEA